MNSAPHLHLIGRQHTSDTLADDLHKPLFFGTYTQPPRDEITTTGTFGLHSRISSSGAIRMGAGRGTSVADDVAGDAAVVVADHTALQLYVMTAKGGAVTTMTDHTNALTANDDSTAPRFPTAAMMRVGSGYPQYEGELDMTILRIWNRVLSASEIIAEAADARSFMSKLGVTV